MAPPPSFRRAFGGRRELVELFIFDAETAREMRKKTNRNLLSSAILEFGGYSQIHDMIGEMNSTGRFEGGRLETIKSELEDEIGRLNDEGEDSGRQQSWNNCLIAVRRVRSELLEGIPGRAGVTQMQENLDKSNLRMAEIDARLDEIETDYGRTLDNVQPLKKQLTNSKLNTEQKLRNFLNRFLTQ